MTGREAFLTEQPTCGFALTTPRPLTHPCGFDDEPAGVSRKTRPSFFNKRILWVITAQLRVWILKCLCFIEQKVQCNRTPISSTPGAWHTRKLHVKQCGGVVVWCWPCCFWLIEEPLRQFHVKLENFFVFLTPAEEQMYFTRISFVKTVCCVVFKH